MTESDFDKSVCLYYTNDSHRGPGKVVQNLTKGLERIGVTVNTTSSSCPSKYHGVLQDSAPEFLEHLHSTKAPILMGPNLFVLPKDRPDLCQKFNHFVVPSVWVFDLYRKFEVMRTNSLHVWSVGIETDVWTPLTNKSQTELDCFIYFKNRSEQDLRLVEALCKKFNLKYKVMTYGAYKEDELFNACQTAKFAILLTAPESQGIAYMQVLSTNTPCYVFNSSTWKSDDNKMECVASSVPYFDKRCGEIVNDLNLEHFSEFLNKLSTFEPREYILETHTLEFSANRYFSLLKKQRF